MRKMILCSGVRAKTPYYFEISETRVYSIEELVFYLYQNLYGIQEETLDESLAVWIGSELKLPETAGKLSGLIRDNAPVRSRVLLLFHSCSYYSEDEITSAGYILEEIAQLSAFGRLKLRAENSLRYHNYVRAAYLYENLLKRPEASKLAPEEYGMILHNQAVAHLYTMSCEEAAEEFREAYEKGHRQESLDQYLYALLIAGQQESFDQAIISYGLGQEHVLAAKEAVDEAYETSKKTPEAWQLRHAQKLREEGRTEEYYESVQRMMERWKKECRKHLQ